ncbi:MAG TPA: hypothetical protein VGL44_06280 [Gaiellales bacterium]|jgi:hypothetical protein
MRTGRSITALVLLTIVLVIVGGLAVIMIYAHIAGRTTAIPAHADG